MNREGWRSLCRYVREARRAGVITSPRFLPGGGSRALRAALRVAFPLSPPRPRMESLREMARKARAAGDHPAFAWLDSRPLPFRPPLP